MTAAIIPRSLALAACFSFAMVGCEKDGARQALSTHLSETVGESRVVDRTQRGAKVWFVVEHQRQAFKVAVASVPPHQVVEDRFPDLLVRRSAEKDLSPDLHPVVHVVLSKAERGRVTNAGEASKVRNVEKATIYFAVLGDHPSPLDKRADAAIKTLGKRFNGPIAWEVNYYDESANVKDLRYKPVVALGFMQQTAEHYPQTDKLNFRRSGTVDGDEFIRQGVDDFVRARQANERAQQEVEAWMEAQTGNQKKP